VLTAPAGAGKTFAFATARDVWERAGYRVTGAAHTGVAADEQAMAAGIPSTTIARLLIAIDRHEPGSLDERTVLVVDEAGTTGTRDLARLLAEADRTGAKAVLVGDPRQLPEIAAGGLFAALTTRLPTIELNDNRRQQHEWEIEALRQLRDGDTSLALHAYLDHGRITIGCDAHHTKTLLLGDWWASVVSGDDAVMLAGRRADVAELNMCGHVRSEAAGHLTGPVLDVGSVPMKAGDKVMMLRNDRKVGVRNGNRGVVIAVDPGERTMRVGLRSGIVDVPARYVDAGHVGLAYAMTVNKAHGMTCDATMMLGDDLLYRELAYEAMSRGRKDNRIYMSNQTVSELDLQLEDGPHARTSEPPDAIEILTAGLERRHAKNLALDGVASVPFDTWSTRDLIAERHRVCSILDEAPPDRSADLSSMVAARRDVETQLQQQKRSVAALAASKPRRRERPSHNVSLTTGRHNLAYFERQAERLDREIAALHTSQHRRASHLTAHHADRVELDAISHVLDDRIRQHTNRAVAEPPSYVTRSLGQRPRGGPEDRAWVSAVVAIETYRVEHDVTARRTALGPEPADRHVWRDWHRTTSIILDAVDAISPPVRPAPTRAIAGPALEIGL
jgi:hypothetical protein